MRDYKELYREAKGDMPRIYVDMDGVLCDFVLAAKRATGQNWQGLRSGQDWEAIKIRKTFGQICPGLEMANNSGLLSVSLDLIFYQHLVQKILTVNQAR